MVYPTWRWLFNLQLITVHLCTTAYRDPRGSFHFFGLLLQPKFCCMFEKNLFEKNLFRHLECFWCTLSSLVELLFFRDRYCFHSASTVVIWWKRSNRHLFWRLLVLVLWPPRGRKKSTTKEHRLRKFLCDEKVDYLCAYTDLNNKFSSPNDGYLFSTLVSNVLYVFMYLDISPHSFRKLMWSYKAGAGFNVEDKNKTFCRS